MPLRELGPVNFEPLRDTILAQEQEAWQEDLYRQEAYDVHHSTESIVMLFVELDHWPKLVVSQEPGWARLSAAALPVMNDIISRCYEPGGTVIRAVAAKLRPGANISSHIDNHPSFHHGHRIHVPITTNPRVRFMIDGRPYQFQPGKAYEINNQLYHSVMNKGSEDRITFIFDYVPAGQIG